MKPFFTFYLTDIHHITFGSWTKPQLGPLNSYEDSDGDNDGDGKTIIVNCIYNNCKLECIKLGTCTELLLKSEWEKTFFGVLQTAKM